VEVLGDTDVEISKPEGGFFIWIKLPAGTNTKRLWESAVKAGVQYTAGPAFFINGGGEDSFASPIAGSFPSATTRAPSRSPRPSSTRASRMARQRHLPRAPITEALIDFR